MDNLNQEESGFATDSSKTLKISNPSQILFDMSKLGTFVSNDQSEDEEELSSSEEEEGGYVMTETLVEPEETQYKPLVIEEMDFPDYYDFHPRNGSFKVQEQTASNLISRD